MHKPSILIVEDNNIVMLELKDRLQEMGYTVIGTASSGSEAIEKAEIHRPDLTMMDIRLKGDIDGIDTAQIIRKRFDTPVVYLTAHTDENTLQRAKLTEPYGYIIKPFEERELHSTIEMALYKHSMEKKLKESEHWLSATLKSIGDALIATDSKGRIKIFNKIAEEITGWKMQEAFGLNIKEVFKIKDKDQPELLENPVDISLRNGSIVGAANKYLIAKDGSEIPIDFSSAPINYGDEESAGVVLVFRNISERIKSKEIIEKQHIFLRNIIDTDPNYISVKNSEGKFALTNKATAEALGTTTDEILGKYDAEFFSKEEIEYFRRTDNEVINFLKETFIPEDRMIDSRGKVHLLQTFKRAIDSQDGNEKLVLSVGSDITSLKQTEKALRESEKRIKTLLKAIPDIVLRFSRNGILLDYHMNQPNLFLPETKDIIGKVIYEILEKNLAENIVLLLNQVFATNQVQIFEFDGLSEEKIVYNEIRILNNSQNEFIVILRDITERKKSQIELKELNASKDKFFSIIAHDLRNPFTSLLGLTDYMATEIKNFSEEELVTVSGGISKSAQSIYNLLENLLEWSRIKTGRIPYDPVVFALKEVVDRIIAIYKSNLESKNISLSVDVNPSLYVFADVNTVETILRNLISNAIKFTESSGKIGLQAIEKDTIVEINIKDSGVGIAEDIIPKLFKIDENVSSDGTRKEHGSGLGLILCKEFVEMNKGKLTFTTKVGEGSTFSFTLQKK